MKDVGMLRLSIGLCAFLFIANAGAMAKPVANEKSKVSYKALISNLELSKLALKKRYQASRSNKEKDAVLNEAREQVLEVITNSVFPAWYGTIWAYSGMTTQPREGFIACGYFVTTVLKQTGLSINRVKLAQAASETMINAINNKRHMKRFRKVALPKFVNAVKELGAGLFIVGLDNHTGFLFYDEKVVYFIHSSYQFPFSVLKEKALESQILQDSKYRVIGKLFNDNAAMRRWLGV